MRQCQQKDFSQVFGSVFLVFCFALFIKVNQPIEVCFVFSALACVTKKRLDLCADVLDILH